MKPLLICLFSFVPVWGWAAAQPIDVPLKFQREDASHYYDEPPVAFSAVRIAPFDMLAPGAGPTPLSVDFTTTKSLEAGLKFPGWGRAKSEVVAGRQCMKGALSLKVDDPTSRSSQGDLYLLVDYFDEAEPGAKLGVRYPANILGQCVPSIHARDMTFENSRTWKQHQFLLKSAWFGGKAGNFVTDGPWIGAVSDGAGFCPTGHAQLEPTTAPLAGVRVPAATTTEPLYAQFALGDTTCSLMFDKTTVNQFEYDRLIADLNLNKDLTDDKAIEGKPQGNDSYSYVRLRGETTVTLQGKPLPFPFEVSLTTFKPSQGKPDRPYASLSSLGSYAGQIVAGSKRYNVAVSDANANGRFDDLVSSCSEGYRMGSRKPVHHPADYLYIASTDNRMWYDDAGPLGLLFIGDTLYDVKIDIPAGVMHLLPFGGKTARLKTLMSGVEQITLVSSDLKRSVFAIEPTGGEILVPEGEWKVAGYRARRVDSDGAEWRLVAIPSTQAKPVRTRPEAPVPLVLGEPYRLLLSVPDDSVQKIRAGEKKAELEYVAVGKDEEIVLRMQLQSGVPLSTAMTQGQRINQPKEPAYQITKPDGELLARGSFEYG